MSKITIVGAGNVGATCANVLAVHEVANQVCLIDIKEGFAEGKAMDIMQTSQLIGFDTVVNGVTNDFKQTADSDIVIVTSGMPRKPGMTREELIGVNAGIVKGVVDNCLKYSPDAILIIVANPMDPLAYLTYKSLKLPRNRVIGMGGALDSARFKYFLSQAIGCNKNDVEGMVIGGHGDTTMIPLARFATYKGMPVSEFLSSEEIDKVVKDTMTGGATLTKLLGTSAWMAPGAAAASVAKSIIKDEKKMIPCAAYLDGEYGMKDITIGVPVILGKTGIEKIVELQLNIDEKIKFAASEAAVRKTNAALYEMKLLK
ncbi:MAG: malate dehydrogenase [Paludibacteraceae bacterium]|nr:malate dehydrogenase [Paludibacteraceae bacterium]